VALSELAERRVHACGLGLRPSRAFYSVGKCRIQRQPFYVWGSNPGGVAAAQPSGPPIARSSEADALPYGLASDFPSRRAMESTYCHVPVLVLHVGEIPEGTATTQYAR
jgi:hypothetical protein